MSLLDAIARRRTDARRRRLAFTPAGRAALDALYGHLAMDRESVGALRTSSAYVAEVLEEMAAKHIPASDLRDCRALAKAPGRGHGPRAMAIIEDAVLDAAITAYLNELDRQVEATITAAIAVEAAS